MAVSAPLSRALFDYFQNYFTCFQLSYKYLVAFQDKSVTSSHHHCTQTERELHHDGSFKVTKYVESKGWQIIDHIFHRLTDIEL
jgi:hypothetical protein